MYGPSSAAALLAANPYGSSTSSLAGLSMPAYGAWAPQMAFAPALAAAAPILRRAGRWTSEEEIYARAIIANFQSGKIDLEVSLAVFKHVS
jgi:hypothetical protein